MPDVDSLCVAMRSKSAAARAANDSIQKNKKAANARGEAAAVTDTDPMDMLDAPTCLRNFVTQGKLAAKGSALSQTYNYYSKLPFKSAEKQLIANKWAKDRSCKWFNISYKNHGRSTKVEESDKSGCWRTKYWIAKELGMSHESLTFLEVLKGYREGTVLDWNETDPTQKPFKDAGLLPYFFIGTDLEQQNAAHDVVPSSDEESEYEMEEPTNELHADPGGEVDPEALIIPRSIVALILPGQRISNKVILQWDRLRVILRIWCS